VAVGLAATRYPAILGNGRGAAQLGFVGEVAPALAAVLFVAKLSAAVVCLRAGASGGLLTPSLALGALMATVLGAGWSLLWPGAPLSAFAVVGGAAFLAASQKMPLTAAALAFEFTRVQHDFLFPIMFAVAGAVVTAMWYAQWEEGRRKGEAPGGQSPVATASIRRAAAPPRPATVPALKEP
jgi:H+/Cl- antiporter ClcA